MKRDSAAIIFRTVVFAGAMLGTSACSKKPVTTTPSTNTAIQPTTGGDPAMAGTPAAKKPGATDDHGDPCADPCGGVEGGDPGGGGERPRGNDDDGGGMGRGFILS